MGKLKLHNLARLPLFSPSPFFSPSSPSLILQMLCLHQYKGLRSSLSLSLLQDTAAVSAGSGVHIDLPLGTHINEIWSFFFFPSLGADKRFTPPKIQRDAAAILAEHLNMFVCSVFSLLLSLFPPRHNENIWQEVNSISTTFYRTGRVGLVVNWRIWWQEFFFSSLESVPAAEKQQHVYNVFTKKPWAFLCPVHRGSVYCTCSDFAWTCVLVKLPSS